MRWECEWQVPRSRWTGVLMETVGMSSNLPYSLIGDSFCVEFAGSGWGDGNVRCPGTFWYTSDGRSM